MLYLSIFPPEADHWVFTVRLQSDDLYNWPHPVYDGSADPAWKGFEDLVTDETNGRFWPFTIYSLAGTPLADRGYVATEWIHSRNTSALGFSDDGLHFDMNRDNPWQDPGSDAPGHLVWNERSGLFHVYTRQVNVDRRIALATSPDLRDISDKITVIQSDSLDRLRTEFYEMVVRSYEDMFVAMLKVQSVDRFEERRTKETGRMETELAYSYNGVNWYRPEREPFIPIRDYGLLGGGQVYGMEMVRTPENKLMFIATGTKGEHSAYRDMQAAGMDTTGGFGPLIYEMRLDGFCYLKTWGRQGVLRTKTMVPRSPEMSLNLRTTGHTSLRVQILDGETAKPIDGYTWDDAAPITGDHLFAVPHWNDHDDLAALVGKPVRIEIEMRETELYAIRLEHDAYYATEMLSSLA